MKSVRLAYSGTRKHGEKSGESGKERSGGLTGGQGSRFG